MAGVVELHALLARRHSKVMLRKKILRFLDRYISEMEKVFLGNVRFK